MEERLDRTLERLAEAMHWMGKPNEGNAAVLLARLMRVTNLRTLDELEAFVEAEERHAEEEAVALSDAAPASAEPGGTS